MRFLSASILLVLGSALAGDIKLGYNYSASSGGGAHFLGAAVSREYFEAGARIGYGAFPLLATYKPTDSTSLPQGSSSRTIRSEALKLDLPVRLKYGKWPYLIAKVSYERIVDLNSAFVSAGSDGFAKLNAISVYPGVGYEFTIKDGFGLYLTCMTRRILTDTRLEKYHTTSAFMVNGRAYSVDAIDPNTHSNFFWEAGISFIL